MKTTLDYINEENRKLNLDRINEMHKQIQELLKYQEFMENRKNKINKLKQNINGKVHCL